MTEHQTQQTIMSGVLRNRRKWMLAFYGEVTAEGLEHIRKHLKLVIEFLEEEEALEAASGTNGDGI